MTHLTSRPKLGVVTRLGALIGAGALTLTACGGVETTTGGGGSEGGDYPSGPVEMYVGASAGGSSDLISRAVSKGLSEELGTSFPVINREGANGALAAAEVAKAEPDGQVIAIQNASLFAITPLAVSEDEATSIEDFDVLHGVSRDDYVMVTHPESGLKSVDDLKGQSGIKFGTTGVGTGSQVSSELLFKELGVDATMVPFDGGAPTLTAVLGNQVAVGTVQIGEAIENIESGKLVPLTVFSEERIEYLPEVPTAMEQGVDVSVSQYRFLTTPKGTPDDVKETLVEALQATFETEEYQQFNEQNSLTPMEISGEEVVAQLEDDKQRYAELVEQHGINLSE